MFSTKQKEKQSKKIFTYKDYLKIDDDKQYEVINGELIMSPSPIEKHQKISIKIEIQLYQFEEKKIGKMYHSPLDVVFSETEVYQPDILFILKENYGIIKDRIEGVPDLIIEITSPSTEQIDRQKKYETYEKCGVKEYWIVDEKNKTIEVFSLVNNSFARIVFLECEGIAKSKLIKGFEVKLSELF